MARAVEHRVPPLDRLDQSRFIQLRAYLVERDTGQPQNNAGLLGHSDYQAGSVALCQINWTYDQAAPPRGLPCDGFIIWIGYTTTAGAEVPEPTVQGCKVSAESRSFIYPVPPGVAMRFGVQPYRQAHQGEFRGIKYWPDEWICDNRAQCVQIKFHLVFTETFNNGVEGVDPADVTRIFVPRDPDTLDPVTIHTIDGVAQASLFHGNSLMPYAKTSDPWEPPVGCWTLDGDGNVKLAIDNAPEPTDYMGIEVATVCP